MGAHMHARTWLARILARALAPPYDIGFQFFQLISSVKFSEKTHIFTAPGYLVISEVAIYFGRG